MQSRDQYVSLSGFQYRHWRMHTTQHLQEKNKKQRLQNLWVKAQVKASLLKKGVQKGTSCFRGSATFGDFFCMRIGSSSEWLLLLLLLLLWYLRYSKSVQPLYEPVNMSDLYCPLNLLTCLRPDTGRPNIESLVFYSIYNKCYCYIEFQRPLVCPTLFYISSTPQTLGPEHGSMDNFHRGHATRWPFTIVLAA